jgi:kynurenine formamidase
MTNCIRTSVTVVTSILILSAPFSAFSQTSQDVWWPSKWGEDDKAGASNHVNNESVLAATQLIRQGQIFELGRVYEPAMPLRGERVFTQRISATAGPQPERVSPLVARVEYLCTEIGHVGTQVDGLGHVSIRTSMSPSEVRFYNGHLERDVVSNSGLRHVGIENMKPLFTRGVLIDVAREKGRMLEAGEEILLEDITQALTAQNMSLDDIHAGDVVLINTGWGRQWETVDSALYHDGAPGIGMQVARWLIERDIVMVGSDTWNTEVQPHPDPDFNYAVHNELLTKNGIYIQENLFLEELSANNVFEFAYVYNRVPIRGATGSPGSPMAIR